MKYSSFTYKIPDVMIKERLIESAFHDFTQKGFIATNPDSITKKVGVSRVAFYSYFKNKNDILLTLAKMLFDDFSPLLNDIRAHKLWMNSGTLKEFSEPVRYVSEILTNSSGIFGSFIQGMMGDRELLDYFDIRDVMPQFCQK